jgi:mono/diheme cytochrome c family protein
LLARRKLGGTSDFIPDLRIYPLRGALLIVLVCVLSPIVAAQPPHEFQTARTVSAQPSASAVLPPASPPPGDVDAGTALFTGRRRFQNGGPACASCHSAATVPFPRGGTMAPDLSH